MWWQGSDGVWRTERGDRDRPNPCRIMWADEWDLDAQVIALIQNQHHFHEVSRLDRFMTGKRSSI
jgi:hypothetical protein